MPDLRDGEGGDAEQQQRHRAEHDERAEFAELLVVGLVHHAAGEDVGEGIKDANHQQQGSCCGCADAGYVRVVEQQEHGGCGEGEVVGGIAGAIAENADLGQRRRGRRRPLLWLDCFCVMVIAGLLYPYPGAWGKHQVHSRIQRTGCPALGRHGGSGGDGYHGKPYVSRITK